MCKYVHKLIYTRLYDKFIIDVKIINAKISIMLFTAIRYLILVAHIILKNTTITTQICYCVYYIFATLTTR